MWTVEEVKQSLVLVKLEGFIDLYCPSGFCGNPVKIFIMELLKSCFQLYFVQLTWFGS